MFRLILLDRRSKDGVCYSLQLSYVTLSGAVSAVTRRRSARDLGPVTIPESVDH